MNIDLLFTAQGEAGLICSENPVKKAVGIVFDTETGVITAEYADMDYTEFNIPVDSDFFETLDGCPQIHLGAVKQGKISQAYQVPFMFLDDPYRMESMKNLRQPQNPLQAFEYFIKDCISGQPVHRDDLGNEDTMGCVLGDAVPASLEFAPASRPPSRDGSSPKSSPQPRPLWAQRPRPRSRLLRRSHPAARYRQKYHPAQTHGW